MRPDDKGKYSRKRQTSLKKIHLEDIYVARNYEDVADELCECGHRMSEHGGTEIAGSMILSGKNGGGHGKCMFENCNCEQFTWVAFLDKDGNKI